MPERSTTARCTSAEEVGGVHAGEPTVAAPDRGPHRFHHYDVAHVMTAWFAGMGTSR